MGHAPPAAASVPHPVRLEPLVRRAVSLQTITLAAGTALASPLRHPGSVIAFLFCYYLERHLHDTRTLYTAPQSTERVSSSFEFTHSSCKAKYNIVPHPLKYANSYSRSQWSVHLQAQPTPSRHSPEPGRTIECDMRIMGCLHTFDQI